MDQVVLESSWKKLLINEFSQPYMKKLKDFLTYEKKLKQVVYPKNSEIFNAFTFTPYDQVKVVIIGQDPYHGLNQAHGLCFSVLPGIALPPSLLNIYKELYNDLKITRKNGCLISWAQQGVLLLNSVLTVRAGLAGSHANKGWEQFTDQVIANLNLHPHKLIFLLWGNYALNKGKLINSDKHIILTATHPSPFSAHRGFLGCNHFSKVNQLLCAMKVNPINWEA